jgi:glutamate synthase (NADPH/NADH) small chain
VTGITFATMRDEDGRLVETGDTWTAHADLVFKAIGQTLDESMSGGIALHGGRIHVDAHGRTSRERVWAGGDCTWGGKDLTVEGVEHGKIAAHDIDRELRGSLRAATSAPRCAHMRRVD